MTNAPPKKRPWFQLHLSKCVVLMLVGGTIVWMNTLTAFIGSKPEMRLLSQEWVGEDSSDEPRDLIVEYEFSDKGLAFAGWPFRMVKIYMESRTTKEFTWSPLEQHFYRFGPIPPKGFYPQPPSAMHITELRWLPTGLVLNCCTLVALTALVAFSLESLARRRERARAAREPAP